MSEYTKSIVLMGCKHCGKTTQGKNLAKELNLPFYDTDQVLEQLVGMPFRDFYLKKGPAQFLLAEEAACKKIVDEMNGKPVIIATGGGICDNAPALEILRPLDKFVFLQLDINYSIERITRKITRNEFGTWLNAPGYVIDKDPKSMQEIVDILRKKFTDRYTQYKDICDIVVDVKNASIEENYKAIRAAI